MPNKCGSAIEMDLVYRLLSMELRKEIPEDPKITEDTFQEYNELSPLLKGSFFSGRSQPYSRLFQESQQTVTMHAA